MASLMQVRIALSVSPFWVSQPKWRHPYLPENQQSHLNAGMDSITRLLFSSLSCFCFAFIKNAAEFVNRMTKHLPTIKEIAQALNVSVSTVSRALQNDLRIGLRTRMRVQELAQKLHYIPNQNARHLRQHRSFTIGVLLPQLREEFFSLAIAGIEDALEGSGYQVFIVQSRDKKDREVAAVRSFLNSRVDGVIASISAETINCQHFSDLQDLGIPVVFFDRVPKDIPAHTVRCDVESGARAAVQHLIKRGNSKIALLNGPEFLEISQERLRGLRSALSSAGLPSFAHFEKFTDLSSADIACKMEQLFSLPEYPEAILAFNDYVALEAMLWSKKKGKMPNEEVVFASFANLPITHFLDNPPVVSVEQFAYQMGESAAGILLELIKKTGSTDALAFKEIMLETQLVVH
ncbi:MAG: LacI family DNA-binding transcriptional regulator [Saprospiraceae bacterium]|nr:LacI family DNA-binding transcriptional regulator [Saprospiraceae bacterium]